ncbi:MAG: DedA family protein [Deltaproteobacteria bacterium]|nr:DedA family protein [Deltaproteobacteria bacterium]
MDLESLIRTYGYLALFVGTFLEGETILVIAAAMAHHGYLRLPWVVLVAMLGSMSGDQLAYYLGRTRGASLLAKRPRWQARVDKARRLFERHKVPVMLGFRFLYGLRNVTPLVIGISGVSYRTFGPLNALGAAVWAACFSAAGYLFGAAVHTVLRDARSYELWIFGGLALTAVAVALYRARR